MILWEYKSVILSFMDSHQYSSEAELNVLGLQGWEAVGMISPQSRDDVTVLLKRRLPA